MKFKQFIEQDKNFNEFFWNKKTPRQKYVTDKLREPAKTPPMFSHGSGSEEEQMAKRQSSAQSAYDAAEARRRDSHKARRGIKKRRIGRPPEVS